MFTSPPHEAHTLPRDTPPHSCSYSISIPTLPVRGLIGLRLWSCWVPS